MARYLLQDLLNVRQLREDAAHDLVMASRRVLEQAEQEVVRRKQELVDYTAWRIQREAELYDQIINHQVQLRNLDDLKIDIQLLREKESLYEQRILEAQKGVEDARNSLHKAEADFRQASKDKRKLEEHKDMWVQDLAKEAEVAADKETEDFKVKDPDVEEEPDEEEVEAAERD